MSASVATIPDGRSSEAVAWAPGYTLSSNGYTLKKQYSIFLEISSAMPCVLYLHVADITSAVSPHNLWPKIVIAGRTCWSLCTFAYFINMTPGALLC